MNIVATMKRPANARTLNVRGAGVPSARTRKAAASCGLAACATVGLRAFTLIELILVMGVLAALAAMVVPVFGNFFRGQDIAAEGKRFIALTEYAQTQAISTGVPQTLWLDAQQRAYGVREAYGYSDEPGRTNQTRVFLLGKEFELHLDATALPGVSGEIGIYFLADGLIGEGSVTNLVIEHPEHERLYIALGTNGLRYQILGNERLQ